MAERHGLGSKEKLPPVELIENFSGARKNFALDRIDASGLLKATTTPRSGESEASVANKPAATVSYKRHSKAVEMILVASKTLDCRRFLQLQALSWDNGTLSIELGSLFNATFALAIKAKTFNAWILFSDRKANALLTKLLVLFQAPAIKDNTVCETSRFNVKSELRCDSRVSNDLPEYMKTLSAGRLVLMRVDDDGEAGVVVTGLVAGVADYSRDTGSFVVIARQVAVAMDRVIGFPEADWICSQQSVPTFSIAAATMMKRAHGLLDLQQACNADVRIQRLVAVADDGAGNLLTADPLTRRAVRFELMLPSSGEAASMLIRSAPTTASSNTPVDRTGLQSMQNRDTRRIVETHRLSLPPVVS